MVWPLREKQRKKEEAQATEQEIVDPKALYAVAQQLHYILPITKQESQHTYQQLHSFIQDDVPILQQAYADAFSRLEKYVFAGEVRTNPKYQTRIGEVGVHASAARLFNVVNKLDDLRDDFPTTMSSLDGQVLDYEPLKKNQKDEVSEQLTQLGYAYSS